MPYEPLKFQQKLIKKILNKNALVCAPTNSGKTIVAYEWSDVFNRLNDYTFRKIIFTSPIKALSNERFRKLKEENLNVGLVTGDVKWDMDAKVLCMTQEIYAQGYYNQPCDVIIDEFHYIFQNPDRARCYMESIDNTHKDSKILLMSATCKEPEKLAKYLKDLTTKKFVVAESNERLVQLEFNYNGITAKEIRDAIVFVFSVRDMINIISLLTNTRNQLSKQDIKKMNELSLANKVTYRREWNYGISAYHGKLLPKEKRLIELFFSKGYIDTVVGTDALALGVNFPAKTVVITTCQRPTGDSLEPSEFHQLIGRAGRYGFHDIGIATFLKDSPIDYSNNLKSIFRQYSNSGLENIKIRTEVDIKALFNGRSNEEEVDLLYRYRYPISDVPEYKIKRELNKEVEYVVNMIKAISNDVSNEFSNDSLKSSWQSIMKNCYLQEWELETNANFAYFTTIELNNKNRLNVNSFLDNKELYDDYENEAICLRDLLFMLKYVHNIEDIGYTVDGVDKLKSKINSIDHTVFDPTVFVTD